MPAKSAWFLRLPKILEEVRAIPAPVVDRTGFERLFRVRRRRAIELMHHFGGYQTGKTFIIDRPQLVAQLERALASPDYEFESHRKQRLVETIDALRRYRAAAGVSIPVAAPPHAVSLASLPPDVHLGAGRLTVDFTAPEDLLAKLFTLAQTIAGDFEGFCRQLQEAGLPVAANPQAKPASK